MYVNKEFVIKGLQNHFQGLIDRHIANAMILITNPVGVAEHPDTLESIETELGKIADYEDKLNTLNAYFSASGIITFKNSVDLQETFKSLPLEKILIETDSPFLAPVPNRGKKNEPSFIQFTANKLAEIKNINVSKLIEITTNNFNKLFFN